MALNITINKNSAVTSLVSGDTVATAVVSGGTTPYTFSLVTGGEFFAINSATGVVTVLANMDINNIHTFNVKAVDSTSGTPQSVLAGSVYPNLQATIQNKFSKPNVIYKIVRDYDLGHGVLTIPEGCTLDFQGGSFTNGTVIGNGTKINAGLQKIFDISTIIDGSWNIAESYPQWFGGKGDNIADDTVCIQKSVNLVTNGGVLNLCSLSYKVTSEILIENSTNLVIKGGTINQNTKESDTIHLIGYSSKVKFIDLNLSNIGNDDTTGSLLNIQCNNCNFFEYNGGTLNKGKYGIRTHGSVWMSHFERIWVLYPYSSGFYFPASGDIVNSDQLGGSTTTKFYKCFVTDVQTSSPAYAIGTGYDTVILDTCSADRCYKFGFFKASPLYIINCSSEEVSFPIIPPPVKELHQFITFGSGTYGKLTGFHIAFKSDFVPPTPPEGQFNSFLYELNSNIEVSSIRGALPSNYYTIHLEGGQVFGLTQLLGLGIKETYNGVYYTPSNMVIPKLSGMTTSTGLTKLWDFSPGFNSYILTFNYTYQSSYSTSSWLVSTDSSTGKGTSFKISSGPDYPDAITVTVSDNVVNCNITGANLPSSWEALKIN